LGGGGGILGFNWGFVEEGPVHGVEWRGGGRRYASVAGRRLAARVTRGEVEESQRGGGRGEPWARARRGSEVDDDAR